MGPKRLPQFQRGVIYLNYFIYGTQVRISYLKLHQPEMSRDTLPWQQQHQNRKAVKLN